MKSEFGKGFIYNLILFSKHWWKCYNDIENYEKMAEEHPDLYNEEDALEMWFNGASDHLYELQIPKKWESKEIGRLAKWIQDKGLYWGHGFKTKPTKKDFDMIFNKVEKLARLIDKELGVNTKEAEWK